MTGGERIGQYELLERLGRGASAEVWRARHVALGSLHAVKILTASTPQLARRLLLEGQVQARLRHPNIVPVTDLIQQGELFALVMEFVRGGSLLDRLRAEGPMAPERIRAVLGAVLDGLDFAHRAGVLHRDLKLANVLLDGDTPRIADFGLARHLSATEPGLTRAGQPMGTPGYMPPEQWADPSTIDARADLFALGVITYELLTGSSPFTGDTPTDILAATVAGRFTDVRALAPGCPEDLAAATERALAPDRSQRFADCRSMAAALSLRLSDRPLPDLPVAEAPPFSERSAATLVAAAPGEHTAGTARRDAAVPIDAGPGVLDGGIAGRIAPSPDPPRPAPPGASRKPLVAGAGLLLALAGGALWLGRGGEDPAAGGGGGETVSGEIAGAEVAGGEPTGGEVAAPPCEGERDELLGYWYPGRHFRGRAGDVITVGVLSHVREEYPTARNSWREDAPIRCVLQPGQQVRLREDPLLSRRGRPWLALYGGDLL